MATVQKSISESSSYTTRTLTTTISAPGIRQNAEISVSPSIDASKVSYVINEAAGTITVTLTNAGYTSSDSSGVTITGTNTGNYTYGEYPDYWLACEYTGGGKTWVTAKPYNMSGDNECAPTSTKTFTDKIYYFNYTVVVIYKTFPEFAVRQNGQLKSSTDGWVRVNGQLRQIQQMWARVNGNLKEV